MPIQPIDFISKHPPRVQKAATARHWSKVLARQGPNPSHTPVPVRLQLSDPSDTGLQPEHFPIFPVKIMLIRFASYLLHPVEPNDLMCKFQDLKKINVY